MGIASLVLGIIALVFIFFPYLGWLGCILGIVGIILGAIGKKKGAKCATGGLVCSIIAVAIDLGVYIACAACVGAML